jgi:hypothetical protein
MEFQPELEPSAQFLPTTLHGRDAINVMESTEDAHSDNKIKYQQKLTGS